MAGVSGQKRLVEPSAKVRYVGNHSYQGLEPETYADNKRQATYITVNLR